MHAPPQATDVKILTDAATLKEYDAFLFGIPTRYGNFPAQWKVSTDSHSHSHSHSDPRCRRRRIGG